MTPKGERVTQNNGFFAIISIPINFIQHVFMEIILMRNQIPQILIYHT